MSIVPVVAGNGFKNVSVNVVVPVTIKSVNVAIPGTDCPIFTLSMDPASVDEIDNEPLELIETEPEEILVFPCTVRLFKVPTVVKLLLTIPLASDVGVSRETPFDFKVPKKLMLPLESTKNPGLSNPVSDLRGFWLIVIDIS